MKRSKPRPIRESRAPMALDDPVPSGSSIAIVAPDYVSTQPHAIETAVRRRLDRETGVRFLELVVRRMPDGVCLEGVAQVDDDCPDLSQIVRDITGVQRVVNRLLVLPTPQPTIESEECVGSGR